MARRSVPIWYVITAGAVSLALGIFLTWVFVISVARSQRSATCDVVEASRAEKQAQIDAYRETPPTTEAGRNLQIKTQASLTRWEGLWHTLGCKEASNG